MTMFTYHRDKTLSTKQGHSIEFKKGVPTHVPPECYAEALAIGAEPDEKKEEDEDDGKKRLVPPDDVQERKKAVLRAMEQLAVENDSKKFTGTGMPTAKALKDQLGYDVDAAEAKTFWTEYAQSKGKK